MKDTSTSGRWKRLIHVIQRPDFFQDASPVKTTILTACLLTFLAVFRVEAGLLSPGSTAPDLSLGSAAPVAIETYLGIESRDEFLLSQIQAGTIVLYVYSLYCIPCNRNAPRFNEFYELLDDHGLSGSVKIIGIAPGNNEAEVDSFRTRHQVPFPLFADPDYDLHAQLGETAVPTVYVLSLQEGRLRVLHAQEEAVDDAQAFLELVKELSDL